MDTDFSPEVIFYVFDIPITETVVTSWIIIAILVILSIIGTRNMHKVPTKIQNIVELLYEGSRWLVDNTMGKDNREYLPYIGTLSLYLLLANLTGIIMVRPPTADVNTPFALAIITFVLIHVSGMKAKGVGGYMRGFLEPMPFLLPLNIISELSQPVSLAFRLFGNMIGSFIIMFLLYMAAPLVIPVIPHIYFDIFTGIIQTFIFVMLTMTYISLSLSDN